MDIKNLDALLEYQKVDIQLRKLLDEIERNDDNKKLEHAKAEFNSAKSLVSDTEKMAESIIGFYNNAAAYYEENCKKIDEVAKRLAESEDEEERKQLASQLEVLREKFADLEKKLNERREKSDKVIRSYLEAQDRGKKMRDLYNNVKARLEAFKKDKEPAIKELTDKLKSLRADLESDMLENYSALTAEKKYPAFVQATLNDDKKNYRCFCGLTLSQKAKSELLENSFCRCETCRRVLYKR